MKQLLLVGLRGPVMALLLFALCGPLSVAQTSPPAPAAPPPVAAGTEKAVGQAGGVAVRVKVQGPSEQETPLQVVCVFEYNADDIYRSPPALPAALNGLVHVDQALGGLLTELRRSGRFHGYEMETLLLETPPGSVKARQLLLVGLGDRHRIDFSSTMHKVGLVGMREALRLGVASYSHSSDLKDAGLDSPAGDVVRAVLEGALEAYRTQQFLAGRNAARPPSVQQLTLLAGPSFFAPSAEAAAKFVASYTGK
ncbi:M17 family peptidase N-terminal domain-containing protein [Hymenobacter terricola]|uniref:M17 family peptidase N-terminal domain-containing protein n=1 Tax=Hymenobacter terricola TaxID=2819236 RepID=UPI001B317EBE|nr:M17 family peptidase N-terminal domain-containing protein [Hymenobacter terricola]